MLGRVTNCTKSNALNYSMVFWDQVFASVAAAYPRVETDSALVDAFFCWYPSIGATGACATI